MQTYHNDEYTDVYAGFFVRLIAFLLDFILIGIGSLIVSGMFSVGFLENNFLTKNILFHYSLIDIMIYILQVGYFAVCTYTSGTTLGKYIMKLKVIDQDGAKLTFINVLYRESIGRFLSSVFLIGYIMIIIDKENRSLHDRLCNTRVVYSCKMIKRVEIHQSEAYEVQSQPVIQEQLEPMEEETKEA